MLFELTYTSKIVRSLDEKDILLIQTKSHDLNVRNSITGCLVLHDHEFVGILEGEEKAVRSLFNKIKQDSRNGKVVLLSKGSIDERQFESWNMIFQTDVGNGKGETNERLFIDNLISLTQLVEKRTRPSKVFWESVTGLLEKSSDRGYQKTE